MNLTTRDERELRTNCVRSAMVMIAHELDVLLDTPGMRHWCSDATVNLVKSCLREKDTLVVTREVVLFARRCAQLACALSWGEAKVNA